MKLISTVIPRNNNFILVPCIIAIMILSGIEVCWGATITSRVVTGNWSAATSWVGGIAPTASDDAVIVSGATITVATAITRTGTTTVNTGGRLTISAASTFSGTNTINGILTLGANLTGNLILAGTVSTSGTSTYTLTGDITGNDANITIAPVVSSTLYITGKLTSNSTGSNTLTINGPGKISVNNFTLNSDTFADISSTAYLTVRNNLYLDNKAQLTVNGIIIVKGNFDAHNNGNIITSGNGYFSVQGTDTAKGAGSVKNSVNYCLASDPCSYVAAFPLSDCNNVCVALGGTPGVALPITLISFNASYQLTDKRVKLNWLTATEINNDYFTLERSTDARVFEVVDIVKGGGNSRERLAYVAYDNSPLPGVSYYRLKQTDFDGQFAYSKPLVIDNPEATKFGFTITPNPIQNLQMTLRFNGELNSQVWISIYSSLGQPVYEGYYTVGSQLNLPLPSSLPGGMYWVKVNQAGQLATQKVLVMN
ncbi:MAG: T9SS type A sorting domain-containing protein [Bacteroidota bacterium]